MVVDKRFDRTLAFVAAFAACFIRYYSAAFTANPRCLRIFRNLATTWRVLCETALGALELVLLAAQVATLYLPALEAKEAGCFSRILLVAVCFTGSFAAVAA